jgi:hypothetical protein
MLFIYRRARYFLGLQNKPLHVPGYYLLPEFMSFPHEMVGVYISERRPDAFTCGMYDFQLIRRCHTVCWDMRQMDRLTCMGTFCSLQIDQKNFSMFTGNQLRSPVIHFNFSGRFDSHQLHGMELLCTFGLPHWGIPHSQNMPISLWFLTHSCRLTTGLSSCSDAADAIPCGFPQRWTPPHPRKVCSTRILTPS